MRILNSARLGLIAAAALFLVMGAGGALAQQQHKTGGLPTPAAEKAAIPQAPVFRDFLPEAVDLSKYMPAVGDQENEGSCVGWATAYAARAYYAEQVEHRDTSQPENIPSPGYLFDAIHLGSDCEGGAYIADAMRVLMIGAYSLKDYPYDDSKCPRPPIIERTKATDFRIDSYELVWDKDKLTDLDRVKGALAKGNPVVIIADLDKSFWYVTPEAPVWNADATAESEGGHAITLVGYDDRSQTFKFINQWGTSWGVNGYGRMSYDTFAARVFEGYIMHMPGDPDVTLAESDFVADTTPVPVTPPPPKPPTGITPLTLRPTETSRDLEADLAPAALDKLACGHVDITTTADGDRVAVGFVGTQTELDAVNTALQGKVNDNQVSLAPWPACEVRMTLASQLADTDTPQALIDPPSPKVGDSVQVGIQSPGFASYVYAVYFSADGTVVNLAQPSSANLKPKAGHTQLKFGDAQTNAITLQVQQPVGDEMLLVVASERPLFDQALPEQESNRAFLSDLRKAVLTGDAGRVTATALTVTTTE